MDLEDFTTACKLPQWGNINDPHKSEFRDFLASITVGESRDIAQATIGSIHFPAIHYFALFIGKQEAIQYHHYVWLHQENQLSELHKLHQRNLH